MTMSLTPVQLRMARCCSLSSMSRPPSVSDSVEGSRVSDAGPAMSFRHSRLVETLVKPESFRSAATLLTLMPRNLMDAFLASSSSRLASDAVAASSSSAFSLHRVYLLAKTSRIFSFWRPRMTFLGMLSSMFVSLRSRCSSCVRCSSSGGRAPMKVPDTLRYLRPTSEPISPGSAMTMVSERSRYVSAGTHRRKLPGMARSDVFICSISALTPRRAGSRAGSSSMRFLISETRSVDAPAAAGEVRHCSFSFDAVLMPTPARTSHLFLVAPQSEAIQMAMSRIMSCILTPRVSPTTSPPDSRRRTSFRAAMIRAPVSTSSSMLLEPAMRPSPSQHSTSFSLSIE
uniref:Uncharacterized protein n=1 Tax=Oryza rufipogon TaxID=4529 RepID=A0A0E0NR97_ORYRU